MFVLASAPSFRRVLAVVPLFWCAAASAEVVRFEIERREPFADGASFAEVGSYEQIVGRVHFAIDADATHNQQIVDLKHAPRNDDGRVEFQSDLFILAPKDLKKGNGAVLYDVNNRGNKLAIRFFNDAPGENDPKSPGNGFLMRHGYTIVWSGWDGELLPGGSRLRLSAPVASHGDKPITGLVRYEISTGAGDKVRLGVNRANHGAYRPTEEGLRNATLTWRLRPGDPRVTIPRRQFRIHVAEVESDRPGQLPQVELELPAGFRKGYLYELIFEARDPLVHGVCFASLRDLITAIKRGEGKDNPLVNDEKPMIDRAHGFGVLAKRAVLTRIPLLRIQRG